MHELAGITIAAFSIFGPLIAWLIGRVRDWWIGRLMICGLSDWSCGLIDFRIGRLMDLWIVFIDGLGEWWIGGLMA